MFFTRAIKDGATRLTTGKKAEMRNKIARGLAKKGKWLGAREGYGGLKPPFMSRIGATSRSAKTKNDNRIAVITP